MSESLEDKLVYIPECPLCHSKTDRCVTPLGHILVSGNFHVVRQKLIKATMDLHRWDYRQQVELNAAHKKWAARIDDLNLKYERNIAWIHRKNARWSYYAEEARA
jgi:hypothetical protein